jgi:hypothetical protein
VTAWILRALAGPVFAVARSADAKPPAGFAQRANAAILVHDKHATQGLIGRGRKA